MELRKGWMMARIMGLGRDTCWREAWWHWQTIVFMSCSRVRFGGWPGGDAHWTIHAEGMWGCPRGTEPHLWAGMLLCLGPGLMIMQVLLVCFIIEWCLVQALAWKRELSEPFLPVTMGRNNQWLFFKDFYFTEWPQRWQRSGCVALLIHKPCFQKSLSTSLWRLLIYPSYFHHLLMYLFKVE